LIEQGLTSPTQCRLSRRRF